MLQEVERRIEMSFLEYIGIVTLYPCILLVFLCIVGYSLKAIEWFCEEIKDDSQCKSLPLFILLDCIVIIAVIYKVSA